MSDHATETVAILDRLTAIGIPPDRARIWITAGGVLVDGALVTDPNACVPGTSELVLHSVMRKLEAYWSSKSRRVAEGAPTAPRPRERIE